MSASRTDQARLGSGARMFVSSAVLSGLRECRHYELKPSSPARFLHREGLGRTDGQLVFLPCAQSNLYTCAVPYLEFVSAESVEPQ